MDQHELQSGFLSALYAFSKESFTESKIEQVLFDDIKISFYTEKSSDILIAFIHPREFKDKKIRQHLEKAWIRFNMKFTDESKELFLDSDVYEAFRDDLRELGITPNSGLFNTKEMQKQKDKYSTKYPNIFQWIKTRITK